MTTTNTKKEKNRNKEKKGERRRTCLSYFSSSSRHSRIADWNRKLGETERPRAEKRRKIETGKKHFSHARKSPAEKKAFLGDSRVFALLLLYKARQLSLIQCQQEKRKEKKKRCCGHEFVSYSAEVRCTYT